MERIKKDSSVSGGRGRRPLVGSPRPASMDTKEAGAGSIALDVGWMAIRPAPASGCPAVSALGIAVEILLAP